MTTFTQYVSGSKRRQYRNHTDSVTIDRASGENNDTGVTSHSGDNSAVSRLINRSAQGADLRSNRACATLRTTVTKPHKLALTKPRIRHKSNDDDEVLRRRILK